MKKIILRFSMLAFIMTICVYGRCAQSDAMSDNVKDYEILRPRIFNTDNNAPIPNTPNKVYVLYVTTTIVGGESITIQNNSGRPVDLAHWTLGNSWNPTAFLIPQGPMMYQGNMRTFSNPGLGFKFNDKGETIYLKDDSGETVDMWKN